MANIISQSAPIRASGHGRNQRILIFKIHTFSRDSQAWNSHVFKGFANLTWGLSPQVLSQIYRWIWIKLKPTHFCDQFIFVSGLLGVIRRVLHLRDESAALVRAAACAAGRRRGWRRVRSARLCPALQLLLVVNSNRDAPLISRTDHLVSGECLRFLEILPTNVERRASAGGCGRRRT